MTCVSLFDSEVCSRSVFVVDASVITKPESILLRLENTQAEMVHIDKSRTCLRKWMYKLHELYINKREIGQNKTT